MTQSSFTLLDIVGLTLHAVGEESVQAFNTPLSTKAKEAVQAAFSHFNTIMSWEHLKLRVPASSWASYQATVDSMSQLLCVQFGSLTTGYSDCIYLPRKQFFSQPVIGFTSTATPANVTYTQLDINKFAFNPYPTDVTTQAMIMFEIVKVPSVPQNPTDTFEMPEEFKQILVWKAASNFAATHVRDVEMVKLFQSLYEDEAANIRSRQGNKKLSMQRTGRW